MDAGLAAVHRDHPERRRPAHARRDATPRATAWIDLGALLLESLRHGALARRARATPDATRNVPRLWRAGAPGRRLVWRVAVSGRCAGGISRLLLRRVHRNRHLRHRVS